jgi:hypothetical protein
MEHQAAHFFDNFEDNKELDAAIIDRILFDNNKDCKETLNENTTGRYVTKAPFLGTYLAEP